MASDNWRDLYPFASHELVIDGLRLHYLDEGSGPTLLLLHGNPTWSFFWREMIKSLRGRYRVVVPDLIGHGLSDKPSRRQYGYRLADRIGDIRRLIEHLDLDRITLIAHDWGGPIGLGAAIEMPERFAGLVLMNTAAFRATRVPFRIRLARVPGLSRLAIQGLNLFTRAAIRMASNKPERMTPAVRAGYLFPYDSWVHRESVYQFPQDLPLRPSHPSYETLLRIETGLAQFRDRPVCLVWGMQDWCFPPQFLERFKEIFPQAEAHPLADAGHYLLEDEPEQVVSIVERFLAGK